jgi:uncharacterized membrane protein
MAQFKQQSSSVNVTDFPAVQPVSATALPLPTGAATQTTLAALLTKIEATLAVQDATAVAKLTSIITLLEATLKVSATALPLPTGAATQTTLAALLTKIEATLAVQDATAETRLASIITLLEGTRSTTVANFPATQPVSATALPLPTGAATQGTLASVLTKIEATLAVQDTTAETKLTAIATLLEGTLKISATALPLPAGAATQATLAALLAKVEETLTVQDTTTEAKLATIAGLLGSTLAVGVTNFPATQPVSATALPLPAEAAKDGTDAETPVQLKGGIGIRGWLSGIYQRLNETLTVKNIAANEETKVFKAASETLVMAVSQGMGQVTGSMWGTYTTVSVALEVSFNSQVSYQALVGSIVQSATGPTSNLASAQSSETRAIEAALPVGATHVRLRCSALTSGEASVKLSIGPSTYESAVSTTTSITSGTSTVGAVLPTGSWTELTKAVLAANAEYVGITQEVTSTTTTIALGTAGITSGMGEIRLAAISNVAGILYLESSFDATTWTRTKMVTLAQADSTCSFYGEIIHRPSEKYVRVSFKNGATIQTAFKVQTMKIGMA